MPCGVTSPAETLQQGQILLSTFPRAPSPDTSSQRFMGTKQVRIIRASPHPCEEQLDPPALRRGFGVG